MSFGVRVYSEFWRIFATCENFVRKEERLVVPSGAGDNSEPSRRTSGRKFSKYCSAQFRIVWPCVVQVRGAFFYFISVPRTEVRSTEEFSGVCSLLNCSSINAT